MNSKYMLNRRAIGGPGGPVSPRTMGIKFSVTLWKRRTTDLTPRISPTSWCDRGGEVNYVINY